MFDLHNNVKVLNAETGLLSNDTALVLSADRAGYRSVELFLLTGTLADAAATFVILVEDSADNSAWAAVADDFLAGLEIPTGETLDQADDNKVIKIGYVGAKRYIRITVTPTGNADASPYSLLVLGGHAQVAPITTQVTTNA